MSKMFSFRNFKIKTYKLCEVNEEDHLRIIAMDSGDGIRTIFKRFTDTCHEVERVLANEGLQFAKDEHLGYITSCP